MEELACEFLVLTIGTQPTELRVGNHVSVFALGRIFRVTKIKQGLITIADISYGNREHTVTTGDIKRVMPASPAFNIGQPVWVLDELGYAVGQDHIERILHSINRGYLYDLRTGFTHINEEQLIADCGQPDEV
jgi:hypothetical protein